MAIVKDKFGPELVIETYNPESGIEGFLIIDNTAFGPGKGGIRMTPDVTKEEVFRLARTMTWKNALAEIPFGGAKAGIRFKYPVQGGVEQEANTEAKRKAVQWFAGAIKLLTPRMYIAGPDVNTTERDMQWFVEATGNWRTATGKPSDLCMQVIKPSDLANGKFHPEWRGSRCGIPHEFGSTGFGVVQAASIAAKISGIDIKDTSVAIHGFGNVGSFVYKFLTELGAKVILIADARGAVFSENGFDRGLVEDLTNSRRSITEYPGGYEVSPEGFWATPVDILIPASVTDVINDSNKDKIKAKIIVEAGNIPMSEKIEEELWEKKIMIVPDFVANAGGVISSYAEYRGYNPKRMFDLVSRKIVRSTNVVLRQSLKNGRSPREVALEIARERVLKKMEEKKDKNNR